MTYFREWVTQEAKQRLVKNEGSYWAEQAERLTKVELADALEKAHYRAVPELPEGIHKDILLHGLGGIDWQELAVVLKEVSKGGWR